MRERPDSREGQEDSAADPPSRLEVLIQIVDGGLVAIGLRVAVGVRRLRDRRVAELSLYPPEIGPRLQDPGREHMPCRAVLPVGQPGLGGEIRGSLAERRDAHQRARHASALSAHGYIDDCAKLRVSPGSG
jgi:hypothetical protein